jgi:hypothetical protein
MSLTLTQAQMDDFRKIAINQFCQDLLTELAFEFYCEIHAMTKEKALAFCHHWVIKAKDYNILSKQYVFIFMKAVFTLKGVIESDNNPCKQWFEGILMDDSYLLPQDKVEALYKKALAYSHQTTIASTEF